MVSPATTSYNSHHNNDLASCKYLGPSESICSHHVISTPAPSTPTIHQQRSNKRCLAPTTAPSTPSNKFLIFSLRLVSVVGSVVLSCLLVRVLVPVVCLSLFVYLLVFVCRASGFPCSQALSAGAGEGEAVGAGGEGSQQGGKVLGKAFGTVHAPGAV